MVDSFDVSEAGTHVALIEYSTEASIQLKFNDFSGAQLNAVNVKRRVQKMPHKRGFTYIDKALTLANTEIFTKEAGMRDDAVKVCCAHGYASRASLVIQLPHTFSGWYHNILRKALS